MSSHKVPGANAEQRVEEHIKELRAQLQITPAEQPQWEQFANVMRENARAHGSAIYATNATIPDHERFAEHEIL